jgi:hypothetical protein
MIAKFQHCTFRFRNFGCETTFLDGVVLESFPHPEDNDYHIIAARLGYHYNLLAYCREHDFFHNFCADWFLHKPSPSLWASAHEGIAVNAPVEEMAVHACQRWVRANERPIISGVNWDRFKSLALDILSKL